MKFVNSSIYEGKRGWLAHEQEFYGSMFTYCHSLCSNHLTVFFIGLLRRWNLIVLVFVKPFNFFRSDARVATRYFWFY